jgi:hypothetical protein
VSAFPVDNNGVLIQLPGISTGGAVSVLGSLVFGIGTQANNGLDKATVIETDEIGYVKATYPVGGTTYGSFLDSGSNGLYFLNATTSKLSLCTGNLKIFYCPSGDTEFTAEIVGGGGARAQATFSVANASKLRATNFAFSNLAGPMPGFPTDPTMPGFDFGLPFFFGRNVYTAIEGKKTPGGTGPYFAF